LKDEIEINWQCQSNDERNYIQPKMYLAVHAAMKYPRKEKVGKRECEEQPRACKDSLANVTLSKMDPYPAPWWPT